MSDGNAIRAQEYRGKLTCDNGSQVNEKTQSVRVIGAGRYKYLHTANLFIIHSTYREFQSLLEVSFGWRQRTNLVCTERTASTPA